MEGQLTLFDGDADFYDRLDGQNENSATFRVHASLIYKLGESLIGDEITALSELIKNAYDADAGSCLVVIDADYKEIIDGQECTGKIEISDDGCGMDFKTIVNGWLTLSNSPKKKMKREMKTTPKYMRYPLGDKGLGRLSVQKLGRFMQLTTKTESSEVEYVVTIPWGDFLKNTTIDQIPVKVNQNKVTNHQSYTKIVIKDLVDCERWTYEEQKGLLTNSISKILSPFRSKSQTFRVIAKINGEPMQIDTQAFDELLRTARAKYDIKYKDGMTSICATYKESFFYTRKILDKVLTKKVSFTDTLLDDFKKTYGNKLAHVKRITKDGFVFEEQDQCIFRDIVSEPDEEGGRKRYNDPGEFECEIYEYSLDSRYVDLLYDNLDYTSIINRDEYSGFVERYHGIKVVRDGFLIQGFGEGEGGDWLGLSSSSKTTGKYFDLNNRAVIGCVYLTGIHNSVLKETTNREGFVNDGFYKNFKKILDVVIRRINRNRLNLNLCMQNYLVNSLNKSSDSIKGEKGVTTALQTVNERVQITSEAVSNNERHIKEAQKNLNAVREAVKTMPFFQQESMVYLSDLEGELEKIKEEFSEILKERDVICNEIEAVSLDFEKMNDRLRDLFELAGLGISVETFTHEFDTSLKNIKEKNQKVVKNSKILGIEDLVRHINYVTYSLDALRKQMSYFNPGLKYVRAERQIFGVSQFLEEHKSFYKERCERNNITFQLKINVDFDIRVNKGMLNQVFDNLFNNSEYWLEFSKKYGYIDKKEYIIEVLDRGFVLIWDNGIGISRDIETRLFEPFESKKDNGRGLGLYIVASNLQYNSSSIRLLEERNRFGNLYKFEINFLNITQ